MNNFKKRLVTSLFYIMKWKWQAYLTIGYQKDSNAAEHSVDSGIFYTQ